jgi:aspartate carbamoyltransferase regulatory subunit
VESIASSSVSNSKKIVCANEDCPHYSEEAVKNSYPASAYCSLKCKYTDKKFQAHNETYGD